jgi:hypothetical protein
MLLLLLLLWALERPRKSRPAMLPRRRQRRQRGVAPLVLL